jgi:hypothetical protein
MVRWGLVLLLSISACKKEAAPPAEPAAGKKAPPPASPPDAAPAPPAPDAGLGWRGDSCRDAADCGWDDPCFPRRCGKKGAEGVPCEKSAPAPGKCLCNEDMCTLRPDDAAYGESAAAGCKADADCAVDVGTGTCHLGGDALIGPIDVQGPVCVCDKASTRCRLTWSGPVACKSWRDCSWVDSPRLRPVPASQVPRPVKRQVRPCKDGEVDSVCTPERTCKIVGWKC